MFGCSIIKRRVAERICNNHRPDEGRKEFHGSAPRKTLRDELVLTHLEKSRHLCGDLIGEIVGRRAEDRAWTHMRLGKHRATQGLRPDANRIRVLLEGLVNIFRRPIAPPADDGRSEVFLCRKMLVHA